MVSIYILASAEHYVEEATKETASSFNVAFNSSHNDANENCDDIEGAGLAQWP